MTPVQGRLINMASIVGYFTGNFMACYGASKAAIVSWTNAVRSELKPYGISVIAICPGIIILLFSELVKDL